MSKLPIWIDTDPGVDDAAALMLAHSLPELEIVAISSVAGNVPLEKTTRNALALCELMKADYPVYRGAEKPWLRPYRDASVFHGENGLGGVTLPEPKRAAEPQTMWDALYEAACRFEGRLELVALGPLTNVATAFAKYPKLPELLHRVVIMGGAAVGGNRTPCAEYNIYTDPDAAQAVFQSGCRVVMCGLDVTNRAYLTSEELERIGNGGRLGQYLSAFSRDLLERNLRAGKPGWSIHDACPIWYLARPELFSGREAGVFVETRSELTLGKTVTDLYSDFRFPTKNTLVLLEIDRSAFADGMKEVFCK